MRLHLLPLVWLYASVASAAISYKLQRATNPTTEQTQAYAKIDDAMKLAVARSNKLTKRANKNITVSYVPGVETADGNFNGNIRFGSNKSYMNERTALHEIAHTLGVGQTKAFDQKCASGNWPTALPLLRSWDGPDAKINCGGGHFWPYGLNYDREWSERDGDRHCLLVDAMLADGLAG